MTPEARLAAARNVLVVRTRGNDIPYDVIRTTIEGWGRYALVSSQEKADLVIEVATSGGGGEVRVTSSNSASAQTGRPEQSTSTSKDISSSDVTLTVLDAQNKRVLWHAKETAKYAVKEKARENNLVEAAEKLAQKFHDRIEPR
jgi:predicted Zn-dependent protease